MKQQNFEKICENMRNKNHWLSEFATQDVEAIRFFKEEEDFRPAFFRDVDQILSSMAYTRYMDKTQVFSYQENEHISKRMIHVQLVSKIGRTIGRALGLNEDLIEAAALAHDLGHVPFGHVGETILNQISLEHHEGYFHHNIQSVRLLMEIEKGGKGRNLTLQVLDAVMCHNGEFVAQNYVPRSKTKEEFLKEYQLSYQDSKFVSHLIPMTLEGCVVRISDIIAYLGRDINDACALQVFDKKDLPSSITSVLGIHNAEMIDTIIMDIIQNSLSKNAICMSEEIYQAIKDLKQYNMEHIYLKANPKENWRRYETMFRTVFEASLSSLEQQDEKSAIYQNFLKFKSSDYIQKNSKARIAIDYLAGMTDNYLLREYSHYKGKKSGYNKKEVKE